MISKMLVAIDHTESSQHALLQASSLARSEKSQMVLLSVVPAYNGDLRMLGRSEVLQEMRIPYREALEKAKATVQRFDLPLKSIFEEGELSSSIVSLSDQEEVDLIVISQNDHHPTDRIPIGAIAGKVINHTGRDVLVVPEDASLHLDRIVLAYDKTDSSKIALNKAIELSLSYGAELTIITAFEIPLEGFTYSPEIWEKDVEKARQLQQQAREIAESRGVRHLKTVLKHGKPAAEISNFARSIDAGLIVIGCKPIHSVKKAFMGNVVERMIRNHTIPVWISKSELPAA
jgi:nucleotide-binding universal stress UspA family protein